MNEFMPVHQGHGWGVQEEPAAARDGGHDDEIQLSGARIKDLQSLAEHHGSDATPGIVSADLTVMKKQAVGR